MRGTINIKIVVMIVFALLQGNCYAVALFDTEYSGAFVLPYFSENDEYYLILARERLGKSSNKWGLFGGGIDKSDNKNPIITAAREFREEALIKEIFNRNIDDIVEYLTSIYAEKNCGKKPVVVDIGKQLIVFPIEFSLVDAKKMLRSFHPMLNKITKKASLSGGNGAKFLKYMEINGIAVVKESDVAPLTDSTNEIVALVYDADGKVRKKVITLRHPCVIKSLQGSLRAIRGSKNPIFNINHNSLK